jgi:hypothetical protein
MGYAGARLGFRHGLSKAGIVSNIFEVVFVLSLKRKISFTTLPQYHSRPQNQDRYRYRWRCRLTGFGEGSQTS